MTIPGMTKEKLAELGYEPVAGNLACRCLDSRNFEGVKYCRHCRNSDNETAESAKEIKERMIGASTGTASTAIALVTTPSDAEVAADLKARFDEAIKPVLAIMNESIGHELEISYSLQRVAPTFRYDVVNFRITKVIL